MNDHLMSQLLSTVINDSISLLRSTLMFIQNQTISLRPQILKVYLLD